MLLLHLCWAGSKVSALCRVPLAAPFATSDDIGLILIHYDNDWYQPTTIDYLAVYRVNIAIFSETMKMTKMKPESRGWRGRRVGARPRRAGPERPGRRGFRDLRTSWGTDLLKWDMVDTIIKNTKKWHKKQKQQEKPAKRNQGGDLPIIRILWIIFTSLNILTATEINLLPPSSPRGPGSPCLLSDLL